jgi:hypothetical protein
MSGWGLPTALPIEWRSPGGLSRSGGLNPAIWPTTPYLLWEVNL